MHATGNYYISDGRVGSVFIFDASLTLGVDHHARRVYLIDDA